MRFQTLQSLGIVDEYIRGPRAGVAVNYERAVRERLFYLLRRKCLRACRCGPEGKNQ